MANSISLEVIAKAIITIGHLLLGLAKSGISMADLNDVYGGKKTWRDIFSPVEPIDTSAVNDAIIAGVITITGMPNSDGWYLGTALCPACGLMVTADIDPGGIVKFSDYGIDGNWCSCQGYDLNIYDPRYKAAARQSCRVEKRPCPRCHKRVDAEIRDPEDPRDREVRILAHEGCSYTGDVSAPI